MFVENAMIVTGSFIRVTKPNHNVSHARLIYVSTALRNQSVQNARRTQMEILISQVLTVHSVWNAKTHDVFLAKSTKAIALYVKNLIFAKYVLILITINTDLLPMVRDVYHVILEALEIANIATRMTFALSAKTLILRNYFYLMRQKTNVSIAK